METKNSTKAFITLMVSISFLLIGFIVVGFVIFSIRGKEIIEEEENGANLIINYTDNTTGLKIKDVNPTTDEIGMKNLKKGEFFDFSVEVDLDNAASVEYEIALVKNIKTSSLTNDDVRIYLEKEESGTYTKVFGPEKFTPLTKKTKYGSKIGTMVIYSNKKSNSTADKYRLRMWMSDKAKESTGSFDVEVVVNGKAE